MSDSMQKFRAGFPAKPDPVQWGPASVPQSNVGLGLMGPGATAPYLNQIQAAQELPPAVQRMQGGFGINPQMLGLLQQIAQPQQSAPPVQSPFTMQSRPTKPMGRRYGSPNWSR